jgi:hypothetical protein
MNEQDSISSMLAVFKIDFDQVQIMIHRILLIEGISGGELRVRTILWRSRIVSMQK